MSGNDLSTLREISATCRTSATHVSPLSGARCQRCCTLDLGTTVSLPVGAASVFWRRFVEPLSEPLNRVQATFRQEGPQQLFDVS